jgi:hypothetical protein
MAVAFALIVLVRGTKADVKLNTPLFVLPLALSLAGSNPGIRGIDCHTTC